MRRVMVLFGVLGCTGKEPPIIAPPPDDDGPPITTETGGEGGSIDAAFFAVIGRFAYDPDLFSHVGFANPGEGPSPMELGILFIDTSAIYEGPTEDNSCEVTLEISDPQLAASWVESSGAWTGFDVPVGSVVRDRCKDYVLPGEFQGDAGAHVSKWRWGIGVGPLPEVVEEQLRNTLPPSEWATLEDYIIGAIGWSNAFTSTGSTTTGTPVEGINNQGYATAFEVDGNFEISETGTGNFLPLSAEGIEQEIGVARAYYEVQLGPFEPGTFLTQDPP